MSIDAMQQALKALEYHQEQTRPIQKTQETIIALRKAIREAALDGLAQTSQEIEWDTSDMAYRPNGLAIDDDDIQEYKKPWVGLTDEEIVEILDIDNPTIRKFAYAIEAKLRERNNG
jgi:hypothetical protein